MCAATHAVHHNSEKPRGVIVPKNVRANDSVKRVLSGILVERRLGKYSYWDYDWNGDEKKIFNKIRKYPTLNAKKHSVFIYDNRPNYYASCIYPYKIHLERKKIFDLLVKEVIRAKYSFQSIGDLYWGDSD